jgi:hypothetical protein
MVYLRAMTCRHSYGDPNCSSYKAPPPTPDASKFEVLDYQQKGSHVVLKVKYPNCDKCSYEGTKVLVFLNVSALDVMKWRTIDPHFRSSKPYSQTEAPSPVARFPASEEGWEDALQYAESKTI